MIKTTFKDHSSYFEDLDELDVTVDSKVVNDYKCMVITFNSMTVVITVKDAMTLANMLHLEGAN